MTTSHYGDTDPVAAFATVPGDSALTIIRTSGRGCIDALAALFSRPETLRKAAGHTIVHGWILNQQRERLDEVLVSVFRSPRSYTGEDSADISCHGGISTSRAVMKALLDGGFRSALPGEFTFRAFMNGKLDLTRAESVMELVSAKTDEGRRHALQRLSGALEQEIRSISTSILQALAATELYLDYSEDDGVGGIAEDGGSGMPAEEAAGLMPDRAAVEEARARLHALLQTYKLEKLYRDGIGIAIAGRPNAGKSSLFNRLVREDRAIVSNIPGTTRDWLEAWVSIEGIPVRLLDTAGLRVALDPVEQIGVERSRSVLKDADLILYVLDGLAGFCEEDRHFIREQKKTQPDKALLLIWNKADLRMPEASVAAETIALSAETGLGMETLQQTIIEQLGVKEQLLADTARQRNGIASERQKELLETAEAALDEALELADQQAPLDLVAPELRTAVHALGEISGEISTADILEIMFSRFCVGK